MVGRGAYGAPWMPGRIAAFLSSGRDPGDPGRDVQRDTAIEHVDAMLVHYGRELGLKNARKHVGWYLASSGAAEATVKAWRAKLCTALEPQRVLAGLAAFYSCCGALGGMSSKATSPRRTRDLRLSRQHLPPASSTAKVC